MLKADFHAHTAEDPFHPHIAYTAKELIKHMAGKGYEVLSITCHNRRVFDDDLARYAKKQGVLLIPGMELRMQGRDILLIDVPEHKPLPTTWRGVRRLREEGALVIAPHPYFLKCSLMGELEKNIHVFDAIEYSHWYHRFFNRNRPAVEVAKRYGLPLVGTSDCHKFWQIGHTYSLVDAAKTKESVLEAIRKGKVEVKTSPLNTWKFLSIPASLPLGMAQDFFFQRNI